jgi:polysaccharide transporter, PST family
MFKKFKNIINTEDKKRLASNFFSLATLQGLNYLLPLITFPYLVSTLGIEKFGILAFATAFILFFQVFTDYGFNLTATKEISIYRKNVEKLSEIYSAVMTIKFILLLVSFIMLSSVILLFDRFQDDKIIYYWTFGTVIGNVLFPIWFFQGMERMKYITYLNIIAKSFFTLCIFIFVTSEQDYYIVPLLNSLGFLVVGLISIVILRREFKIKFILIKKRLLIKYFIDGWHIFISSIFINIYSSISILLLGFFTNNYYVGIYSIIDKIVAIFNGLFAPVTQTLYPYIVKRAHDDKNSAILFIKKVLKYYSIGSIVLSLIIMLFAYELLYFISKDKGIALNYMFYLQIASLGIVISRVGEVFGTFTLVAFGYNKIFSKIMLKGATISIVISTLLIYLFKFEGAVISYVLSIAIIVLILFNKSKIIYKKGGVNE